MSEDAAAVRGADEPVGYFHPALDRFQRQMRGNDVLLRQASHQLEHADQQGVLVVSSRFDLVLQKIQTRFDAFGRHAAAQPAHQQRNAIVGCENKRMK